MPTACNLKACLIQFGCLSALVGSSPPVGFNTHFVFFLRFGLFCINLLHVTVNIPLVGNENIFIIRLPSLSSRWTLTVQLHVSIDMAGVLKDRTCRAFHPVVTLEMIYFKLAELPFFKWSTKGGMIDGWCPSFHHWYILQCPNKWAFRCPRHSFWIESHNLNNCWSNT